MDIFGYNSSFSFLSPKYWYILTLNKTRNKMLLGEIRAKKEPATEKCIYLYNDLRLLHYLSFPCFSVASPSPSLSSSGRRCGAVGHPPPSPGACGTRGRRGSGWPPSSTRSNTAGRWRWRRRTARTCRHSGSPGTHRTAGRRARMASLPPGRRDEN